MLLRKNMLLRNLLFYLPLIPMTCIFAFLGMVLILTPFKLRYWVIQQWSRFFIFWAKITCGIQYSVTGLENIPDYPVIIVSNHQSMWETIFFHAYFPTQSWVLKRELLWIPFFGWGLYSIEPIAINRQKGKSSAMVFAKGSEYLKKGRCLILFPEGTRINPGEAKRFSKSGAVLSMNTGVPILPVAHNAGLVWPKGFYINRPGKINVEIGSVLSPANTELDVLQNEIETWIKQKAHELYLEGKKELAYIPA